MVVRTSKQQQVAATTRNWRIMVYSTLILACLLFTFCFSHWYRQATATLATEEARLNQPPVYITLGATRLYAPAFSYSSPSSIWYMTNKTHAITPRDYTPRDLKPVPMPVQPQLVGEQASVRAVVMHALERLDAAAQSDGVKLVINSAYRSYTLQQQLLSEIESSLYDSGTRTAPAGASEHQLGLAVDFSTDTPGCRTASNCYIGTTDAEWLATHAHEYGFILRYPEGKEDITGYEYEPWHYRYVGKVLAMALRDSGLTLDEAWPKLQHAEQQLRTRGEL